MLKDLNVKFMRILIVDDLQISRLVIKNILNDLGFKNTIDVSNGFSALANLKSKIIDCVITSWEMSEMSGLELLTQIKADHLLKNIPVLIAIESSVAEIIISASKIGASGFLVKPFNKEVFSKKLNEILLKENNYS